MLSHTHTKMTESAQTAAAAPAPALTDIEGHDVIRLILQYLAESGLGETAKALRAETGLALTALSAQQRERLAADVARGQWDAVLETVAPLGLPAARLVDLYEHVALELVEAGEHETARALVRQTRPLQHLRTADPPRHSRLERACHGQAEAAFAPAARERRRAEIARALLADIPEVRPSRLLELLGEAVRWERAEGLLPSEPTASMRVDVLCGCVVPADVCAGDAVAALGSEEGSGGGVATDRVPTRAAKTVRLGEGSHFEAAAFSGDGRWLATGSTDGFAELWDPTTGKLDTTTLAYQGRDELLLHGDTAVLCVCFSDDGETLATGGANGAVKVWGVRSGKCLKRIEAAHESGVTCAKFDANASLLFTGSFDCTARAHGLRSGRTLRVFRGHSGFVHGVALARGGSTLVTASADGSVRLWDARTADCIATFELGPLLGFAPQQQSAASLLCAFPLPHDPETLLVCTRGRTACLISLSRGTVLRTFSAGMTADVALSADANAASTAPPDFVSCVLSHTGKWVMCAAEDGTLFCFDLATARLEHSIKLGDAHQQQQRSHSALIGIARHPARSLLASWSMDGTLKLWIT